MKPAGLIIDNFAGGGGASVALSRVFGHVDIAINHNPKALAMHARNHPETRHLCEDVFAVDPIEVCAGRPIDAAWFSPDCTHFSKAKGGKPRKKEIRGLAWVVLRWASLPAWQRPKAIYLENVEEWEEWGPLDEDGFPINARKGEIFLRWKRALEKRGYVIEKRTSRASEFGAKTIRRRLLLIARFDGRGIVWPQPTHYDPKKRPPQIRLGMVPQRTAAECIDFSLPCPSIFGRKRPLAENTLKRVARGTWRYVVNNPNPFIVRVTQSSNTSPVALEAPLPTITTAKGGELALVAPTLVQTSWGERAGQAPRALDIQAPLGTVVAGGIKHAVVASSLISVAHGYSGGRREYDVSEPLGTVASQGTSHALVAAFLAQHNNHRGVEPSDGRPLSSPLSTITMRGTQQQLVTAHLCHHYGSNKAAGGGDLRDPMHTVMSGGGRGGGHASLVAGFLLKYYGTGAIGQLLDEPLHTATALARFGLVTVKVEGETYVLADIGMRMLTPRELYRAQGFPDDYIIDLEHNGKRLTKSDQVAMCGNSVCPDWAEAHIRANNPRDPVAEALAA